MALRLAPTFAIAVITAAVGCASEASEVQTGDVQTGPRIALAGKADLGADVFPVGVPTHGLVCCERVGEGSLREWTLPGGCGREPYADQERIVDAASCDQGELPGPRVGHAYINYLLSEPGRTSVSRAERSQITFWDDYAVAESVCARAIEDARRQLRSRVAAREEECAELGGRLTTEDNFSTSDCVVAPELASVDVFWSASCEYR